MTLTVPAANILEVLGVVNAESTPTWKSVHDGTAPTTQVFGDSPVAGTALTASHRDHKHGMPNMGAGFFGDGSDAGITLQQSTAAPAWASKSGAGASTLFTLTRDVYATTFDMDDSAGNYLVKTAGYRIFASTSLVIDAGVTVHNDGGSPVNDAAGTAGSGTALGGGGGGSAGAVNTTATQATAVNNSAATVATVATAHGGTGGAATGGGTGGGVAGGTCVQTGTRGVPRNLAQAMTGIGHGAAGLAIFLGGGGGTGGNATGGTTAKGGGGGGGGGQVGIYAKLLTNNGIIRAQGGTGGNGTAGNGTGSGGGGGGGGGVIILVYGAGSTVGTTTVTGGTGGNPTGTGAIGGTGVSGLVYQLNLAA